MRICRKYKKQNQSASLRTWQIFHFHAIYCSVLETNTKKVRITIGNTLAKVGLYCSGEEGGSSCLRFHRQL